MAKFNNLDIRGTKKVPAAFGNVFICSGSVTDAKTVVFPDGYLNGATPEPNLAFKAVFPNGHNAANASSYLSLNGIVVVSNQNGTLAPIPIHAMTEGGSTVYKVLGSNTTLEMYYTADYDGQSTPAFVIIGNPVVLSSADYTIYANGQVGNAPIGTIISLYKQSNPYGYLELNGDTIADMSTKYPDLYIYLGNSNVLPDYREFALVGAGQNTTDAYNATTNPNGVIKTHDTYTEGEAKDDALQHHTHIFTGSDGTISSSGSHSHATGTRSGITTGGPAAQSSATQYVTATNITGGSHTHTFKPSGNNGDATKYSPYDSARCDVVTRGKRKAVFFYIKAL